MFPLQIPFLILGAALLGLGRRLFWLFVGVLGFVVGMLVVEFLFRSAPNWLILVTGLAGGAAGALLAILMQRLGIAAAGFLAGAYLVYTLFRSLSLNSSPWLWAAILVSGIVGAVLMSVLFDWALIALSSLTGSVLFVEALGLGAPWGGLLFFGLIIIGVVIQGGVLGRKRRKVTTE